MNSLLNDKYFIASLAGFAFLNLFLFLFLIFQNNRAPLHLVNYFVNSHHYVEDSRLQSGTFNLISSLGVFDAQWYLKIADSGYPSNPQSVDNEDKVTMDGLTYAFFPFYPLLIGGLNKIFSHVEVSAFVLSNMIMVLNSVSLYYVINKLYDRKIARRTIFLIFLYPFSIFFRSYFTEGLFLFLLIWFSYFLVKNRYLPASLFVGLLAVTRPNGIFLIPILFVFFTRYLIRNKIQISLGVKSFLILSIPFALWLFFNFIKTGDPFYWYFVQSKWFTSDNFLLPLKGNLREIYFFFRLPFHSFHASQIDVISILGFLMVLISSRTKIKPQLWCISFVMWIAPLLFKDTMSYSRYQIVSFPMFVYLAMKLNGISYYVVMGIFSGLLLWVSVLFVNWYWIG